MVHYLFIPLVIVIFCVIRVKLDTSLMEGNVKKVIFCLIGLVVLAILLSGCNLQVFDTKWSFDRAIISLPNGEVVEGKVDSWRDFADGDQLQVKIDGVTYLTHSKNVVLIDEP